MTRALYAFSADEMLASPLAAQSGLDLHLIDVHRFPDGESRVTVPDVAENCFLFRGLHQPNSKIFDVILAASALRDGGAKVITLVAPYLGYMRQDKAFHKGEAVSQKALSKTLSPWIDGLITVDPHLHRVSSLDEVFEGVVCKVVSGADALARHFKARGIDPKTLVMGPDQESEQWVSSFADQLGLDWFVASKERLGDDRVEMVLPSENIKGRTVLIVDDVISSGGTVLKATEILRKAGAADVIVAATHALFTLEADRLFVAHGLSQVVTTDSIHHPSNAVSLAPVLAEAIKTFTIPTKANNNAGQHVT